MLSGTGGGNLRVDHLFHCRLHQLDRRSGRGGRRRRPLALLLHEPPAVAAAVAEPVDVRDERLLGDLKGTESESLSASTSPNTLDFGMIGSSDVMFEVKDTSLPAGT